jgi:hypothetical protein
MATIRLDLNQFKASGIYTLEFDQSENIIVTPQTIRLVVGFSKKGPINTPVYCPDIKTARTIFGGIDNTLERKGSFFHRSLFTCLQTGPVFALNLLALDNNNTTSVDKVNYKSFSIDTAESNSTLTSRLYSSYYNKERFWFPDASYFLSTLNTANVPNPDSGKLLHFTNLGKTPMSYLIKKSEVKGYDVSLKEYYASINQDLPEYLELFKNDFVSDYFVDVIAVEGNWTDYNTLATDPVFSRYFNFRGVKKEALGAFLSLSEVRVAAQFTGCMIPDFKDGNGSSQFIETMINNTTQLTGILCAVNQNALDNLEAGTSSMDLVGHNLIGSSIDSIGMLSYNAPLKNNYIYNEDATITRISVDGPVISGAGTISTGGSLTDIVGTNTTFGVDVKVGDKLIIPVGIGYEVVTVTDITSTTTATIDTPLTSAVTDVAYTYQTSYDVIKGTKSSILYTDYKAGLIGDNNHLLNENGSIQYLRFFEKSDGIEVHAFDAPFSGSVIPAQEDIFTAGSIDDYTIVSLYGEYVKNFAVLPANPLKPALGSNEAVILPSPSIKVGDYLVSSDGTTLSKILKVSAYDNRLINGTLTQTVRVAAAAPIRISSDGITRHSRIQDFAKEFSFSYFEGFKLRDTHLPNGSDARQNQILDVLYSSNLATALKNKDIITFRYIVDTFGGGLEPNSKNKLTKLAKMRSKCLALVNLPSMKQFADSIDPKFTDEPTPDEPKPMLNARYIADGGNLSLNPSFTFSLPTEEFGAKHAGHFSPYLVLRENGKNIVVPPAAHVSNLFVQKFINGTPFSIVAGSKRGIISDANLVGVEYDFSDEDRALLEPIGINPLVRRKGLGVMIHGNQTGFQKINSALNNLHVRDILITIEEDVETILQRYLFDFNDESVRLEIKTQVDNYLDGVTAAGGLYNFTTIMDSSNNTDEIIDQNFGIIDIFVEPARGIHKFLNRITITRTGAIASGGFTVI